MVRIRIVALILACLGASVVDAAACSCWRPASGDADYDAWKKDPQAWRFARAATVLRGRIVEVHLPQGDTIAIMPIVTAKMKVTLVLKGNVPPGDVTLLTGLHGPECGLGSWFQELLAHDREVTLEVTKVADRPNAPGGYAVGGCSFVKIDGTPAPPRRGEK